MSYLAIVLAGLVITFFTYLGFRPADYEKGSFLFVFGMLIVFACLIKNCADTKSARVRQLEVQTRGYCHQQYVCEPAPNHTWIESKEGQILTQARICHCRQP